MFRVFVVLLFACLLFASCTKKPPVVLPKKKKVYVKKKKSFGAFPLLRECFMLDNEKNILKAERLKKFGAYKFSFIYDFSSQSSEASKVKLFCYEKIKHDKIDPIKTMKSKIL